MSSRFSATHWVNGSSSNQRSRFHFQRTKQERYKWSRNQTTSQVHASGNKLENRLPKTQVYRSDTKRFTYVKPSATQHVSGSLTSGQSNNIISSRSQGTTESKKARSSHSIPSEYGTFNNPVRLSDSESDEKVEATAHQVDEPRYYPTPIHVLQNMAISSVTDNSHPKIKKYESFPVAQSKNVSNFKSCSNALRSQRSPNLKKDRIKAAKNLVSRYKLVRRSKSCASSTQSPSTSRVNMDKTKLKLDRRSVVRKSARQSSTHLASVLMKKRKAAIAKTKVNLHMSPRKECIKQQPNRRKQSLFTNQKKFKRSQFKFTRFSARSNLLPPSNTYHRQIGRQRIPNMSCTNNKTKYRLDRRSPSSKASVSRFVDSSRFTYRSVKQLKARAAVNRALTWSVKRTCVFFTRTGNCFRGVNCRYSHDTKKIAICTKFLVGRDCLAECKLSHDIQKSPDCTYFARGRCRNSNCRYRHKDLEKDAVLCSAFATGYCANGLYCESRHPAGCPDTPCGRGSECCLRHSRDSAKPGPSKKLLLERANSASSIEDESLLTVESSELSTEIPPNKSCTNEKVDSGEVPTQSLPLKVISKRAPRFSDELPLFIGLDCDDFE